MTASALIDCLLYNILESGDYVPHTDINNSTFARNFKCPFHNQQILIPWCCFPQFVKIISNKVFPSKEAALDALKTPVNLYLLEGKHKSMPDTSFYKAMVTKDLLADIDVIERLNSLHLGTETFNYSIGYIEETDNSSVKPLLILSIACTIDIIESPDHFYQYKIIADRFIWEGAYNLLTDAQYSSFLKKFLSAVSEKFCVSSRLESAFNIDWNKFDHKMSFSFKQMPKFITLVSTTAKQLNLNGTFSNAFLEDFEMWITN